MTRYANNGRNSGIVAYEIEDDGIIIQFSSGAMYLYTYASAGSRNIEQMKHLAIEGRGLNSFIMKNVRTSYERKLS